MNTKKKWFECPYCGQRLMAYTDTAKCKGLYTECERCGKEIEVKINQDK